MLLLRLCVALPIHSMGNEEQPGQVLSSCLTDGQVHPVPPRRCEARCAPAATYGSHSCWACCASC